MLLGPRTDERPRRSAGVIRRLGVLVTVDLFSTLAVAPPSMAEEAGR
jgi:hypothetical protein